jgi:hypothetical protein
MELVTINTASLSINMTSTLVNMIARRADTELVRANMEFDTLARSQCAAFRKKK